MVARPIGDDAVRSHWLKLPIELHLRDGKPKETPITIELSTGDESMLVETIEGRVRARPARAEHPDAVLTGTPSVILGLLTGKLDLAEARRRGFGCDGDPAVLRRVQPQRSAIG